MDAKVKKEWVEALRSGKYKQGKGKLAKRRAGKKTEYCCLGVLCDITPGVARRALRDPYDENLRGSYEITFDGQYAYLPSRIGEAVGLPQSVQSSLADLNDSGEDFNTIADYIEEKL